MSSEKRSLNDLTALEAALASLAPRADRLDRDRLMFLAGQASTAQSPAAATIAPIASHRWTWPAAFAAMSAVAAGLLVALVLRPEPQIVERIVPVGPESNATGSVELDRTPAAPSGGATMAEVVAENDAVRPESSPAWPFEPFTLGRSDWRRERLAYAGLSRAGYARLLEEVPGDTTKETKESAGANTEIPATASPPVTYRELLDSLLKENGLEKAERPS